MPLVPKVIRDYANVDNEPGFPFGDSGFNNGGDMSIINQNGDDGGDGISGGAIAGIIVGVLLLLFIGLLVWWFKRRGKGGAGGGPGLLQRLREIFGGRGHGNQDTEMGNVGPPGYSYGSHGLGGGHPGPARSEVSIP